MLMNDCAADGPNYLQAFTGPSGEPLRDGFVEDFPDGQRDHRLGKEEQPQVLRLPPPAAADGGRSG
jgi:hypothetical protein